MCIPTSCFSYLCSGLIRLGRRNCFKRGLCLDLSEKAELACIGPIVSGFLPCVSIYFTYLHSQLLT